MLFNNPDVLIKTDYAILTNESQNELDLYDVNLNKITTLKIEDIINQYGEEILKEIIENIGVGRTLKFSTYKNGNLRITSANDWRKIYRKILYPENTMIEVKNTNDKVDIDYTKYVKDLSDLQINPDLYIPLKTNTLLDDIFSTDGGVMPGTNIMVTGAPGTAKTSLLLEMLVNVKENRPDAKLLFISAEMNRIDMARYLKRFPKWVNIPTLFLMEIEDNPQKVIENVLNEGWDLVIVDSYTEVNDIVKEECGLTKSKTEKWYLDLQVAQNEAKNKLQKYTTFITILQMNKGGDFVGSNKLKHLTTAMAHIRWAGDENSSQRYIYFSKNRVGNVNEKLYFNVNDKGIIIDEDKFLIYKKHTQLLSELESKEKDDEELFEDLFKDYEVDDDIAAANDLINAAENAQEGKEIENVDW